MRKNSGLKQLLAVLKEHGVQTFKGEEIEVSFFKEDKEVVVNLKDLSAAPQKNQKEIEEELLFHSGR